MNEHRELRNRLAQKRRLLGALKPNVTPMVAIAEPFLADGRRVLAKLEREQISGSMKYRSAWGVVGAAYRKTADMLTNDGDRAPSGGVLLPDYSIVESSSGSFGVALANLGQKLGHPVKLVVGERMSSRTKAELEELEAELHYPGLEYSGFAAQRRRFEYREHYRAANKDCWCPDQYGNPDNVTGYLPMAAEMLGQVHGPMPAVVVCAVGTGGNSNAVGNYLKQMLPTIKVVGVDTVGSATFGQKFRPGAMTGMGANLPMANVNRGLFDAIHLMDPTTARATALRLRKHYPEAAGGWSVGAVMTAATWEANQLDKGGTVLAVFPDGHERHEATLYSDEYCRANGISNRSPLTEPSRKWTENATRWTYTETIRGHKIS